MERTRQLLAARYELGDVIGRGGMGVVYRATDTRLGRKVAVKLLPADRAADPMLVARFEREALSAAALNHPNIVSVFDTGSDGATHFIVMEYLEGENLATLVRRRGRLPPEEAAGLAAQAASAIGAAHRAGIVHRDIKPANVMVDSHGIVKVLDFGIARATAGTSLTQTALVLGSAPYLAPEVARGEPADERSDIYSLGCVVYELVAGEPPFSGENPAAILHQHNTRHPRPLVDVAPAIPAAFGRLVMRMLAKDPDQRPQSASALAEAIPDALTDDTAPTSIMQLSSSEAPTTISSAPQRRRSRRGALVALAAAVVLALIGLAIALPGSSKPHHPKKTASSKSLRHRSGGGQRTGTATTPPSGTTTTPQTATTTPPATTTSQTTAAGKHAPAQPPTVAQAAGRLTSLATQDLQSGQIDQQAAQALTGQLQGILNAYDNANFNDALNHLSGLTTQDQQLVSHGDIQPAAERAINAAVDSLGAALVRAASTTTNTGPTNTPAPPANLPPGQSKKQHPHH